jgi:hypothetical protein
MLIRKLNGRIISNSSNGGWCFGSDDTFLLLFLIIFTFLRFAFGIKSPSCSTN